MKIAIGSGSEYKVNAIKKALYELDFEFEAASTEVDSEVSEQPHGIGETKLGSVNRARNALMLNSNYQAGIGVEFGYEPIDERFKMVCWATIATKSGKIFSEQSSTLELPKILVEKLLAGEEVSDNLHKVLDQLEDKEVNRLFRQFLKKRRLIYESVMNVGMRFLLDGVAY